MSISIPADNTMSVIYFWQNYYLKGEGMTKYIEKPTAKELSRVTFAIGQSQLVENETSIS